jgi:hypothetical protein
MGVAIPNLLTEDRVSGAQIVDGSLRFDSGKLMLLVLMMERLGVI